MDSTLQSRRGNNSKLMIHIPPFFQAEQQQSEENTSKVASKSLLDLFSLMDQLASDLIQDYA